ncbi:hypothetical protein VPH35_044305 [Triticum aestivum]
MPAVAPDSLDPLPLPLVPIGIVPYPLCLLRASSPSTKLGLDDPFAGALPPPLLRRLLRSSCRPVAASFSASPLLVKFQERRRLSSSPPTGAPILLELRRAVHLFDWRIQVPRWPRRSNPRQVPSAFNFDARPDNLRCCLEQPLQGHHSRDLHPLMPDWPCTPLVAAETRHPGTPKDTKTLPWMRKYPLSRLRNRQERVSRRPVFSKTVKNVLCCHVLVHQVPPHRVFALLCVGLKTKMRLARCMLVSPRPCDGPRERLQNLTQGFLPSPSMASGHKAIKIDYMSI